jgi:nitronate monooxygenase
MSNPTIIQGGMGAGVSNWRLARAVSRLGQMGVVSGTALDVILSRRLQDGDADGLMRHALSHFPHHEIAERVLQAHFRAGGRPDGQPYRGLPLLTHRPTRAQLELLVAANFVEVFLAKEGHPGVVGINFLQKIQLPTLPSLFGAMLAGVDYVLMGAGIPMAIPGILDRLARGEDVQMRLDVEASGPGDEIDCTFSPADLLGGTPTTLSRPKFLPIVSSNVLAITLARKASGRVDGFVVEGPTAGGHNAPPRGALNLNGRGEPVYGPRDIPDLAKFRDLGLPFWLAGSYATPGRLADALAEGAAGVQIGTAFAFCDESGIEPSIKARVLAGVRDATMEVFTDPLASPTGFPFKVAQVEGTLSDPDVFGNRRRLCDLGYLRRAYRKEDGNLGYRCPGEPEDIYVMKGGEREDTVGRKCVCNGLLATIGLAQTQSTGYVEPALLTAGDDLTQLGRFLGDGADHYSAAEVLKVVLSVPEPAAASC